ncbi:MAG: hypothetical protein GC188_09000 [Alphaproteobacteria bacterium]|nr:hypothetical protein [Alphaproteobacteria bacterium]
MNPELEAIPARIVSLAQAALSQANAHATYGGPGIEHWDQMSVINAAHAGELFLKAIIASEHPLLIFKDLFNFTDNTDRDLEIDQLISRGRTHDFEKLPKLLWATTGKRMPDQDSFDELRAARNAIQHFCAPANTDFGGLSLRFLYKNIDPLIRDSFGLVAIEHYEDLSDGYDYLVERLIRLELSFTVPIDFSVAEVDIETALENASEAYRDWFAKAMDKK